MADAAGGAGAGGAPLEVDTGDILRLIMQFLREQGLVRSLAALQDEADVSFNIVDDLPAFTADVLAGRWDVLLPRVAAMALPPPVLMLLYEQVVRELCEAREGDVARALLRGAMPLLMLQQEEPGRYARLEHLAAAAAAGRGWDAGEAYPDGRGKDARRAEVARAIGEHLVSVPPSRLAVLLSHALQWQRYTGSLPPAPAQAGAGAPTKWDVFRGLAPAPPSSRRDVEDRPPSKAAGVIRGGAIPQCAVFTPDGASLVVGSDDGILEVYDAGSGKLRTDLAFQAADEFMMHDQAVTCVAVSRDGGLLASGSKDGKIKVWRLATGECLRRFPTAHPDGGVAALAFSADTTLSSATVAADAATAAAGAAAGSLLLSGGLDGVARIHGLRSGKLLKEFRGHTSYVNAVAWLGGGASTAGGSAAAASASSHSVVVTGSSDGTVRVWDVKTTECLATLRPPQAAATAEAPVLAVVPLPHAAVRALLQGAPTAGGSGGSSSGGASAAATTGEAALVVTRSGAAHVLSLPGGGVLRSLSGGPCAPLGLLGHTTFVAGALSPQQGRYVYLLGEDGGLRTYSLVAGAGASASSGGAPEAVLPGATGGSKAPLALAHHPLRNLVATLAGDGAVRLWKAAS